MVADKAARAHFTAIAVLKKQSLRDERNFASQPLVSPLTRQPYIFCPASLPACMATRMAGETVPGRSTTSVAGIVDDPATRARIIPESRRADGR